MNKNTKNGYFTLEAAIVLPLFILAILSIGYFMKVIAIEESVMHIMSDEARKIALSAYTMNTAPGFERRFEERVLLENANISNLFLTQFKYLYRQKQRDGLILIEADYNVNINLPISFHDEFLRETRLLFRGFIGRQQDNEPMGFDEMEVEQESYQVWVFPRYGEKYHKESCGYIKVEAKQVILNKEVRRKYGICVLCNPGSLPNGALVYCFPSAGEVFHAGKCTAVDRYVVLMERKDAQNQGYAPCLKCGG